MAAVHPIPPPWTVGAQIYPAVAPLNAWKTAAGRELEATRTSLEATRTLLQGGTDSDRRKVIVDAANAILIGASLIASVTYASWLILPYDNIVHKKAVKVFWAFNSLSFFFAVATVLGCASAAMPNFTQADFQTMLRSMLWRLRAAASVFIISVFCVLGAFTSAAYLRVPHQQDTYYIEDTIIVGIIVGGTIFSLLGMAYFTAAMVVLRH